MYKEEYIIIFIVNMNIIKHLVSRITLLITMIRSKIMQYTKL